MKKEVDRTTIVNTLVVLFIFFTAKSTMTAFVGYRLSTFNTSESSDGRLFIIGVKPVVYLNELYIFSQALMFYNYFQLIGSLFFKYFWFIIQTYHYINSFFFFPRTVNIYVLNTLNFIIVFVEAIYLTIQFYKYRATFIWINFEKIGADISKREKIILKEKLKTSLKMYYSMLMITGFNVFVRSVRSGSKIQTVIEAINHLILLFIYYLYIKTDEIKFIILALCFTVYVFIYSCFFRIFKSKFVILPRKTYYLWSGCFLFILCVVCYYGISNMISDKYDR